MAGKRVKKNKAEEKNIQTITQEATMEQVISTEQIDKMSKEQVINYLETLGHNKKDMKGANTSMLQALARSQFALTQVKQTKGRTKKETTKSPFSKRARTVQKFLEYTETVHHTIMKQIVDNPSISGKEVNTKFDIKYGQTCVHHTRVLLNVLYNNGLLNQECIDKLENIMAETE